MLALLFAVGLLTRQRALVPIRDGDASALALQPGTPTAFWRLSCRAQGMLECGFIWAAFVVGLGQASPPIDTLLALTVIMASGAAIATQVSAFLAFTALVLAVIEIPLVAYLLAPQKTQAVMLQLQNWMRIRRRQIFVTMLAVGGVVLVVKGIAVSSSRPTIRRVAMGNRREDVFHRRPRPTHLGVDCRFGLCVPAV